MHSSPQLVVDAGAGHVAGGVFARGADGKLILEEFALETRSADPSLEPGWMKCTAEALAAVAKERKMRGPAALAVPGHLTLTKFIKTPAIAPAKREKVIQFEAAQNIPHPLDAVAWDHLVVAGDALELEIMLTAVKLDVMENLCAAAESAGFPVKRAASLCLALYRAFRFNYPGAAVPALVVDIGARSTNLLLIGPGGRFFARTFLLAGNAITAAVAEELKLDFAEAEALKLQVTAGLPKELQDSPMAAAVQRAAGNFIGRLQLEIIRTAGNFRWRTGAESPVALYLTGGGSLLAGLEPALTEKFRIPVERYDPLRNVELSDRARTAGAASARHVLANLVGLAIPATPETESESGLLPPVVRSARAFRRRQPMLLGAVTLLVLALLPPLWHWHRQVTITRAREVEVLAAIRPMRAVAEQNATTLERIATLQKRLAVLASLREAKSMWVEFLADLQSRLELSENVWLEQMAVVPAPAAGVTESAGTPRPSGQSLQLRVSGRMFDPQNPIAKVGAGCYDRVKDLLASFGSSRFIAAIQSERFDNMQAGMLRFDVTLVVNPQRSL